MKPFHDLSERDTVVAAYFLEHYFQFKAGITDASLIEKLLFSSEVKKEVRIASNMSMQHFNATMKKLRDTKFIVGNSINKIFIPNYDGKMEFCMMFKFEILDEPKDLPDGSGEAEKEVPSNI